jgi:osmotically-inducible protein OsmY
MKRLRFAALGAALAYFFDPENGKRRRKVVTQRLAGLSRRHGKRLSRAAASPDDVTLARKVESEIFRDPEVPKGKIDVNAENGKVVLRGEADSAEMIEELVGGARKVQGVQEVESLLHTPGEHAPMHQ